MDSGMISKIEKSKRYADEPERIEIQEFSAVFHGEHADHDVSYQRGSWSCDCDFFRQRGVCSHTMALERLLDPMLYHHKEEEPVG
jgi:hypothetical protein